MALILPQSEILPLPSSHGGLGRPPVTEECCLNRGVNNEQCAVMNYLETLCLEEGSIKALIDAKEPLLSVLVCKGRYRTLAS